MTTQPKKGDKYLLPVTFINTDRSSTPIELMTNSGRTFWIKEVDLATATILDVPLQGEEKLFHPKYGDEVEVSDDKIEWFKRIFLCFTSDEERYPVCQIDKGALHYIHIRPIPPITPEQELDAIITEQWKCNKAAEFKRAILAWHTKHTPSGKEIKLPSAEELHSYYINKTNGTALQSFRQTYTHFNLPLNGGSFVTTKAEEK